MGFFKHRFLNKKYMGISDEIWSEVEAIRRLSGFKDGYGKDEKKLKTPGYLLGRFKKYATHHELVSCFQKIRVDIEQGDLPHGYHLRELFAVVVKHVPPNDMKELINFCLSNSILRVSIDSASAKGHFTLGNNDSLTDALSMMMDNADQEQRLRLFSTLDSNGFLSSIWEASGNTYSKVSFVIKALEHIDDDAALGILRTSPAWKQREKHEGVRNWLIHDGQERLLPALNY